MKSKFRTKNMLASILLVISSCDVFIQYTDFDFFSNFIKFFYLVIFIIFLLKIKIRKKVIMFFLILLLLSIFNYNGFSFNFYEYIKVTIYTLCVVFFWMYFLSGEKVFIHYYLALVILISSIINLVVRIYLNKNFGLLFNYNWSSYLVLVMVIIIFKNSKRLNLYLFILSIASIYAGSRGVFIGIAVFILSNIIFSLFSKRKHIICVKKYAVLATVILVVFNILTISYATKTLDPVGRSDIELLGKSGLSGRELGYVKFYDYLSSIKDVRISLLLGSGMQNLYVSSDDAEFTDKYAHIYSSFLQWTLFFGLVIALLSSYFLFLSIFKMNKDNFGFAVGISLMLIVFSNTYAVLSMMHYSLGTLMVLMISSNLTSLKKKKSFLFPIINEGKNMMNQFT